MTSSRLGLAAVLACFLTLRLFSSLDAFPIVNDSPKYLALAESFPFHTLYNHQTYLIHSPVVGYVIGLFALVLPTVTAGLLVAVGVGVANFLLTRSLARELGLDGAGQAAALIVLAISQMSIWVDSQVGRMGLLMLFCLAALRSLMKDLRTERGVSGATTLWLCAALATSDQALVLFPATALVCWVRRRSPLPPRSLLVSWLLGGCAFLAWPAFRLWVYLRSDHYPAGIDGTVEDLTRFPAGAIVQPVLLPLTDAFRSHFTVTSFSPSNLDPANLVLLADWAFVPRALAVLACLGLPAAGLVLCKPAERTTAGLLALLTLLFAMAPLFGMYRRYGCGSVYFGSLLIGWGVHQIARRIPRGEPVLRAALAASALVASVAWIVDERPARYSPVAPASGGRHFLFARRPVVEGEELARYLDGLPEDGVMAPVGLVPELAYLCDKRVLALPFHADRLDPLLEDYRVRYVVITADLLTPTRDEGFDVVTARFTAREIASRPEQFERLRSVRERRRSYFRPREYLVFRVRPGGS